MKNTALRGPPPGPAPMDAAAVQRARKHPTPKGPAAPPAGAAPKAKETTDRYSVAEATDSYQTAEHSASLAPAYRKKLPNLVRERIKRQFPHLAQPFTQAEGWLKRRRHPQRERTKRAVATALYVLEAMKAGFEFGDALDIAIAYQGIGPEEMQSTGLQKILSGGFSVSRFLHRREQVAWDELALVVEQRVLANLPRRVKRERMAGSIHAINLDGRRASYILDEDDPRY